MKFVAAILVAIVLCMLPGTARAQCNGQFADGTVCGNATGAQATPRPTPISSFTSPQVGAGCTPIGRGAATTFFSDCTVATGTANAIILTPTFGSTPTTPQLVIFTRYIFKATASNTTATTIRVGVAGPGPYNVYSSGGVALAGGEIVNGNWYTVGFDPALNSSAGGWRLTSSSVNAVSNPKGSEVSGPGIMGAGGVPEGGAGFDNSGLYTGNTVFATNYGKFVTGLDGSGNLISRSLGTLSNSVDGRSLPGFPGGDIPPFLLIPYYAIIAADAPVGLPTLAFGNMVAPNNQKWTFFNTGNDGSFQIGPNADAFAASPILYAPPPQYALIMRRTGFMPTSWDFTVPITVGTRTAFGSFTTNNTNPANGSTLTVNGTVVTFVTGVPSGNQVRIGASAQVTLQNLYLFLSASADVNISKALYTPDGNFELNIQYATVAAAGNSFTIVAGAGSNYTASGATLSGAGGFALAVAGDAVIAGTSTLTVGGLLTLNAGMISTATTNYMNVLQLQGTSPVPELIFKNNAAGANLKYFDIQNDSSGILHLAVGTDVLGLTDYMTVTSNAGASGTVNFAGNVKIAGTFAATTVAGQSCVLAATCGLSSITAALGGDVALNNIALYFDGPSVAQGTTGTWFASGQVTINETNAAAAIICKLWDGTTVIATGRNTSAGTYQVMTLSGILASPAGNIKISCNDANSTTGAIVFNAAGSSKSSILTAVRIN